MVEIIVMSIFCLILIVYGYAVVFKKLWFAKPKNDDLSTNKMRNMMGLASLVFGTLGLVINVAVAFMMLKGGIV
jgi:tellurite resistance protein TehA-like permease